METIRLIWTASNCETLLIGGLGIWIFTVEVNYMPGPLELYPIFSKEEN